MGMNHMSAKDKKGGCGRIVVDSIKRVQNSSLQISVTKKFLVFLSPFRFIQIVYTTENDKIINRFINSAESSTHAIIKNDQNEDADHPKIEI